MKKRLVGGLATVLMLMGLLAPGASADVNGVALFQGGVADVGDDFAPPCTKQAGTAVGEGLGIDPTTMENHTWSLDSPFTFLGTSQDGPDLYTGTFHVCGWMTAPLGLKPPLGATCLSTKGHHGRGKATAMGTLIPTNELAIKLYNVGWKMAVGPLLVVTGDYQELDSKSTKGKKDKHGSIVALVLASPTPDNPTGCVEGDQIDFTIVGAAALVNDGSTNTIDFGKPGPIYPTLSPKKCVGEPECPEPGPGKDA